MGRPDSPEGLFSGVLLFVLSSVGCPSSRRLGCVDSPGRWKYIDLDSFPPATLLPWSLGRPHSLSPGLLPESYPALDLSYLIEAYTIPPLELTTSSISRPLPRDWGLPPGPSTRDSSAPSPVVSPDPPFRSRTERRTPDPPFRQH